MKKGLFLLISFGIFLLASCTKDKCTNEMTYTLFEPVFVLPDSLNQPAERQAPRKIQNTGKIYFYNEYIFINEPREGFHVINNEDPANPVNEQFIAIKGNVDIAVMNDYLYADAYTDLVILDLKDIHAITQINRKPGVFNSYYHEAQNGYILSHYKESTVQHTIDCSNVSFGRPYFEDAIGVFVNKSNGVIASSGNVVLPSQVGKGGSMARITISKGHLYTIGQSEIYALQINDNGSVSDPTHTSLPWGIETIFPYKDYLFIGAAAGMHILSLENPSMPKLASTFEHARACDPVVVQDEIAYVTLRDGSECQGFVNQLEVIDVRDISKPKHLYTYNMSNPHGLAVDDDYLYLCEGKHGLKVFDIKDKAKISANQVGHYQGFHAWDAISLTGHSLLIIGEDGFRQYDHKDPKDLKLISLIGK
jgi:hypothetical protein